MELTARRVIRPAIAIAAAMLVNGCAVTSEPTEPITWSPDWFSCDGRFQCIVVYDAYCNFTSVNSAHARNYELWAKQEVQRLDEKIPCPPAAGQPVPIPYCHKGTCDVL